MGQRTGDSIFESPVVADETWYAARESNPQPADDLINDLHGDHFVRHGDQRTALLAAGYDPGDRE